MSSSAEDWLGPAFHDLHPLLQALHRQPSMLVGPVEVTFARGFAGVVGRRLAARLGVPTMPGRHDFQVNIYSVGGVLHWVRRFDRQTAFHSRFEPVGRHPHGHWLERSGRLSLRLGVRVEAGGWHWVHQGTRWWGVPLPQALMPTTIASKSIEDGRYRFSVAVAVVVPVLGSVMGYAGALLPMQDRVEAR